MSWPRRLAAGVAVVFVVGVVLGALQWRIAGPWLAVGREQGITELLRASRDDQRRLARDHPEEAIGYRERFDELDRVVRRRVVLEHNQGELAGRYRAILFGGSMAAVVLLVGIATVRQARREQRLEALQEALVVLADGRIDVDLGRQPRDLIGRIAGMIERTSQTMARDRRRLAALRNLSAWQEAARRHAHEMRTPLTGARLELARLGDLAGEAPRGQAAAIRGAADSILQELERLGRFTQAFTSFARLPAPRPEAVDLRETAATFAQTFGDAWPGMTLSLAEPPGRTGREAPPVWIDRDLLRQVLVNLCDNAHHALAGAEGSVEMRVICAEGLATGLDVRDDGPGIDPAVRPRLFEPYTTTRGIGEGMGLGLAIARKLMLDQDGDLELLETSSSGTTFRLTLPSPPTASEPSGDEENP